MLNPFAARKERNEILKAERRQMDFTREQNAFNANSNVASDQLFMEAQEKRSELLRWTQDLNDELELLKLDLRSQFLDDQGNVRNKVMVTGLDTKRRPVYANMPPLMNDFGIQMIETEIRPLLSRNLINSNLTDEMIRIMLKKTSNTIAKNMAEYHDVYEIDFANYDHILRMCKNVYIPTAFRSLNGWNKKVDATAYREISSTNTSKDKEKGGWFGAIK